MHRYEEDEIAAEEQRIGARLPDALRSRYAEGIPDEVVLLDPDGDEDVFAVWGPSTTDTDTKGREYPTPGMAAETDAVREEGGEGFVDEDVVVAWGANDLGDLAVVRRDGSLGWWRLRGGAVVAAEVDWDPEGEADAG